jgi:transcriptional regulator
VYLPPKFALRPDQIDAALADAGFAQLVSWTSTGLVVTPLPLLYDADRHALLGHVARGNTHWHAAGAESVAIFTGPQAYISPGWYPTKAETGRVVPTWNYEILNAHGRLRVHDDPDWVLDVVTRLTDRHEAGRARPWRVADAPADFTRTQLRGIVGVELPVERVEAKAKMSQNQPAANRAGVVAGLTAAGESPDVAERVRALDPDREG